MKRNVHIVTRRARPRKQRAAGFTLIELLIVIAIIGILAGLLVPAVMSAVSRARTLQCQSNLKQIATAVLEYSTDYNGRILPLCISDQELYWCNILARRGLSAQNAVDLPDDMRSSQASVFLCPASTDLKVEWRPSFDAPDDPEAQGWYRVGNGTIQTDCSYFWNGFYWDNADYCELCPSLTPSSSQLDSNTSGITQTHNISEIPQTSTMVMVADGIFHSGRYFPQYIAARHPGSYGERKRTNVAYYDGHVESLDRYAPTVNGELDWRQETPASHAGEEVTEENFDDWEWKPIMSRNKVLSNYMEGGPPYFQLPER